MEQLLTASQVKVIAVPYDRNTTLKVVAGPGSGKTLTLLRRIYHLVKTKQVKPDEILVLSLTNKAVDNIIDKLIELFEPSSIGDNYDENLKDAVSEMNISTVHALATKIVTENEGIINVIEESGWRGLMKLVSNDLFKTKNSKRMNTTELQRLFKDFQDGRKENRDSMQKLAEVMQNCRVVTNEELIIRASSYLENPSDYYKDSDNNETRLTFDLQNKIKVLFIDEYQDLFPSLLPFLCKVASQKQLALFGDPNQNIYEFLGSNKTTIEKLENVNGYSNLLEIHLHDNFRCSPEIMDAAHNVIRPICSVPFSDLVLKQPSGVEPQTFHIDHSLDELEFLVDEISQLVCSSVRLSDIAILTRTNSHLDVIAEYLRAYNLSFQKLTSYPDWLTDARIQFLIDLLRMATVAHYEEDPKRMGFQRKWSSDFSVIVTLSNMKGVTDQSIQRLYLDCRNRSMSFWNYLNNVPRSKWPVSPSCKQSIDSFKIHLMELIDHGSLFQMSDPSQLFDHLCKASYGFGTNILQTNGPDDTADFQTYLEQMLSVMKECAHHRNSDLSLAEWFLEYYHEKGNPRHHFQQTADRQERISISTIHSAKGLEFPVVFLLGPLNAVSSMERKALYVGMTRARNLLYLINVNHTKLCSKPVAMKQSLLTNEKFWSYYSRDLKRPPRVINGSGIEKYASLQRKYGFNSYRSFSTKCNKAILNIIKYKVR